MHGLRNVRSNELHYITSNPRVTICLCSSHLMYLSATCTKLPSCSPDFAGVAGTPGGQRGRWPDSPRFPRGNPATSWGLLSSAHCWWCHFSPSEESNSNACNSNIFSLNSVWDPNWYEVFKIYSKSLCANWNLWRWFDALWNSSPGDPYIVFQFLIIHTVD